MSDAIIAVLVTSITSLILAVFNAFSAARQRKRERKENKDDTLQTILTKLEALTGRVVKVEECGKLQRMDLLRLVIMDEGMPISERLIAGQEYMKRGGNGDIKAAYLEMKKEADH